METVVVDLDNVISETDTKIRQLIRDKYGIASKCADITQFNYEDCLPITKDQTQAIFEDFHRHHLASLRVVPGARVALRIMRKHFRIIIATERPAYTNRATLAWIQRRNIPNDGVLFVTDKSELTYLGARWFIDDKWENAVKIADKGTEVILFDHPWNQERRRKLIKRAGNWNDILELLGITVNQP